MQVNVDSVHSPVESPAHPEGGGEEDPVRPHGGGGDSAYAAANPAGGAPAAVHNGGFPEPPPDEPVRTVHCTHHCGAETVVRIPAYLPASVVRRVVCSGCGEELHAFDPVELTERARERQAEAARAIEAQAEAARAADIAQAAAIAEAARARAAQAAEAEWAAHAAQAAAAAEAAAAQAAASQPLLQPVPTPDLAAPTPVPDAAARTPQTAAAAEAAKPRLPLRVSQRTMQLASVPLIALAVILGIVLLGGDDSSPKRQAGSTAAPGEAPSGEAGAPASALATGQTTVPADARFVNRGNYSLALPAGWTIVDPHGGAVFRAVAADNTADATLWIERDPTISFSEFQERSLENLRDLAGNATVHQRLAAPNGAGTIVQLRAEIPTGTSSTPYLVTLRAAGEYRYYLATSVQPDASADVRNQAALIHGSFTPEQGEAGPTGGSPGAADATGAAGDTGAASGVSEGNTP